MIDLFCINIIIILNMIYINIGIININSVTGNRTPVTRVRGEYTNLYTITELSK